MRRIYTAHGGNRIVIRQGGYYRPNMQTSAADLARVVAGMRRKFDARFPMLRGLWFEHVWSGHLCLTRNAVSVMRALELGLYPACVQNGLGTTRGALTGIGAAGLSMGQTSETTQVFTAQNEPARVPHCLFSEVAQPVCSPADLALHGPLGDAQSLNATNLLHLHERQKQAKASCWAGTI